MPVVSPPLLILCTITVLCVCVLIQMLGVSATLFNSGALPDPFGASVSEGFSLPVSVPLVYTTLTALLPEPTRPDAHVPLLPHSLFHPPVFAL